MRAFDLIELNGDDLRREARITGKATLHIALAGVRDGIEIHDHLERDDAELVFRHACKLGFGRQNLEAQGLALPVRSVAGPGQAQEPLKSLLTRC
jgi:hypothetical protein